MEVHILSNSHKQVSYKKLSIWIIIQSMRYSALGLRKVIEGIIYFFEVLIEILESLEKVKDSEFKFQNIKSKLTKRAAKIFGIDIQEKDTSNTGKRAGVSSKKKKFYEKWIKIILFPMYIVLVILVEVFSNIKKVIQLFTIKNTS